MPTPADKWTNIMNHHLGPPNPWPVTRQTVLHTFDEWNTPATISKDAIMYCSMVKNMLLVCTVKISYVSRDFSMGSISS